MKKNILIISLLLFSLGLSAQLSLLKADSAYQRKEYYSAVDLYKIALSKISDSEKHQVKRCNTLFKMAESYRKLNLHEEAKGWYKKSLKCGYKDPIAYYQFADMLMKTGDYKNAAKFFIGYLRINKKNSKARQKLKSCKYALQTHKVEKLYTIENAKELNSAFSDYGVSLFNGRIIISSTRINEKDNEKISFFKRFIESIPTTDPSTGQGFSSFYESAYNSFSKRWEIPIKSKGGIISSFHEGNFFYSARAKKAFFTQCNGFDAKKQNCNIYRSGYNKNDNSWQKAEILEICDDSYNIINPVLDKSAKIMYFVSDRPGGYGGKDIWMASRPRKSKPFGNPVNLGPGINTSGNEMYPYLKGDSVLYFSSDGHIGFGGLDVFYVDIYKEEESKKYISTEKFDMLKKKGVLRFYSDPVNLNIPFNSNADDFGIIFLDSDSGFFCSNRIGGQGDDDIYKFRLQDIFMSLKGRITNKKNHNKILNSIVILEGSDGSFDSTVTDMKGNYVFNRVEADLDYTLTVYKYGYLGESKKFSTKGIVNDIDFSLTKDYVYDLSLDDKICKKLGLKLNMQLAKEFEDEMKKKNSETIEKDMIAELNKKGVDAEKNRKKTPQQKTEPQPKKRVREAPISQVKRKTTNINILNERVDEEPEMEIREEISLDDINLDFDLTEVTKKEITIPNIYYDFNKWDLKASSKIELDKLVNILKVNKEINIKVHSHTDERGAEYYNLFLSQNRAKTVMFYLIYRGIAKERLSYKGWGETSPIFKNATSEEQHKRNRRTAFTINNVNEVKSQKESSKYSQATERIAKKKVVKKKASVKIRFRVQFASSAKLLSPIFYRRLQKNFPTFVIKYTRNAKDGLYKYTIGSFSDYSSANTLRKRIKELGYKSFIIAYKNGYPIAVSEAVRLSKLKE